MDDTNLLITLDIIKSIIKSNYIFNDLMFISRPKVIKVSPKSNMTVIWIDIWNAQNSKNTKMLINRCFNIKRHIATVYKAITNFIQLVSLQLVD